MSFDEIIHRRGTGSIKWDLRPGLDPFWIADMDFQSPPAVIEALVSRARFGVFGYPLPHEGLIESIGGYLRDRHDYEVKDSHLVHLGGLVPALSLAARAFGQPGEELLTCPPVYPPFLGVGGDAGLETLVVPHVQSADRWTFDWAGLEEAVTPKTRLFLLCSPQNPLGRCFDRDEIIRIAEFCQRHDIILVSDEVHCDLILDEERTPFFSTLNLPEELRQNQIVLLSPSKTYNIAGLGYAYAIIENNQLRATFKKARGHTMPEINGLAYYAAEAAYRSGEPWRRDLVAYLRANRDLLIDFVGEHLPEIGLPSIEATYLAWMDCSSLGHDNPASHLEKQGLFVSDGSYFQSPQNIRFNFGCPRTQMTEGLEKLATGFRS